MQTFKTWESHFREIEKISAFFNNCKFLIVVNNYSKSNVFILKNIQRYLKGNEKYFLVITFHNHRCKYRKNSLLISKKTFCKNFSYTHTHTQNIKALFLTILVVLLVLSLLNKIFRVSATRTSI